MSQTDKVYWTFESCVKIFVKKELKLGWRHWSNKQQNEYMKLGEEAGPAQFIIKYQKKKKRGWVSPTTDGKSKWAQYSDSDLFSYLIKFKF